jgi:hypothetical protein
MIQKNDLNGSFVKSTTIVGCRLWEIKPHHWSLGPTWSMVRNKGAKCSWAKWKSFHQTNTTSLPFGFESFSSWKIPLLELNKCLLHLSPYCVNSCNVCHPIMMPWKICSVHLIPQDLVINWCCVSIKPWSLTTFVKRWIMG